MSSHDAASIRPCRISLLAASARITKDGRKDGETVRRNDENKGARYNKWSTSKETVMDEEFWQTATDDLLEWCRTSGRNLNEGRHLAPRLLGHPWRSEDDDDQLVIALRHLLAHELARWQRTLHLPPLIYGDGSVIEWLRNERVQQHRDMEALVFVWAVYLEKLATPYLAKQVRCSQRRVQQKVAAGRVLVAQLLAQPVPTPAEQYVGGGQALQNGHQPSTVSQPVTTPLPPDQGVPATPATAPSPQPHDQPMQPQRSPQPINQHVAGTHIQAVVGPVGGSVKQSQTHHHYYGEGAAQRRTEGDNALFGSCVLAVMGAGYWLIQTLPWFSIGSVLLLTGWRTARNGWLVQRLMREQARGEEIAWQLGHLLAWAGAVVWSLVLVAQLQMMNATQMFSFERLILIVAFVCVCAYVFWLATLDLLRWVYDTDTERFPWRLLGRHAETMWHQRWIMLGITWLMLAVFSIPMILFSFGNG
jgi:hypothetical protein